ncbi:MULTISPECIES: tetratricopeptide repeat protein [Albidovulum]|nr:MULTISPECIES: hypothetical protein [Defluviimonas]
MIAILAGAPDLAADVSDPTRERHGVGRFGARSIWGVSQLMLGDDRTVITAFSGAVAAGSSVSPPSLLFQAVAHHRLGEYEKAPNLIDELSATWPNFPVRFLVERVLRDAAPVERDILEALDSYGFVGPQTD